MNKRAKYAREQQLQEAQFQADLQAIEDLDWRMFSTKEAKESAASNNDGKVDLGKKRKREQKAEKKQVVHMKKYDKLELKL